MSRPHYDRVQYFGGESELYDAVLLMRDTSKQFLLVIRDSWSDVPLDQYLKPRFVYSLWQSRHSAQCYNHLPCYFRHNSCHNFGHNAFDRGCVVGVPIFPAHYTASICVGIYDVTFDVFEIFLGEELLLREVPSMPL